MRDIFEDMRVPVGCDGISEPQRFPDIVQRELSQLSLLD